MNRIDTLSALMSDLIREAVRGVMREEFEERPMVQPRLLDARQAGRYIGRPEAMVRKLARAGRLPVASSDTRLLFDRHDLDCFVEREKESRKNGHAG